MNKKKFLILWIIFWIFLIWTSFIYKKEFFINKYLWYDVFFSKNNSILNESIQADKNDSIAYHIVLPKDFWEKINIDTTELKEYIDIEKIEVNWEKKEDPNNISWKQNTQITFIGKPKNPLNINKSKELIKIIPTIPLEENKEKEKEKETISNIFLKQNQFFWDFNTLVEVSGSWQSLIDFVIIWEKSFPVIEENKKFFINIPKNTFWNGEFFVFIQDRDKNIFPLEQKMISSFSDKDVNVQDIVPRSVSNTQDQNIILQWRGFSKTVSLQLSNNIVLKNTDFVIISDTVLQVKIPKWIEIWNYQLNIMTTKNIYQIQNIPFSITN
jgi:hypothetical protein